MRRPLSPASARPIAAVRAWDRFFFSPSDPTSLGLIRVATGALLLWNFACLWPDRFDFLGSTGWADPVIVRGRLPGWAWSFWLWVPDRLVSPMLAACLVVIGLFTLGVGSRVTAWLAWIIAVSTARRAPVMLFGFDQIVTTWAFYLAVSGASGQALSLDRLRAARREGRVPPRPSVSANLGLRLIQLHLCLIYGIAGLAKLQGPPWWDGSAIGMLLGNSDFRPIDLLWLVREAPGLVELATHATVFLEIFYPVLIWVRPLRPWMIGAALAMHAGVALAMGLTEFSLAMAAGNLAFVPGAALRRLARIGSRDPSGVESPEGPHAAPRAAGPARRAR